MAVSKSKRLKKDLTLFNIFALATGATLSSGFFLLPGLAAAQAGPAVMLSYLIAALHLLPAVLCMAELSTAMPRAGGMYYFLDRSMGPLMGTIGGTGTWLALTLKTSFALVGMGAYVSLFFPDVDVRPLSIGLAILFGAINLYGAKKSGGFQVVLVVGLLVLLFGFIAHGMLNMNPRHFEGFFSKGFLSIYSTAGLVYISYVGITKIASVSEEVENPHRNLPLGMLLALITAVVIYGIGTTVMVGILPPDEFYRDLTPVASAAERTLGSWGAIVMSIAAVLAFFSVSNAGILSASRYPLAMSRDRLMPRFFRLLNKQRMPKVAIYTTVGLIILFLTFFDPTRIAKLTSAFQLLLFAFACLAVIIMRETRIESYDPSYYSPFYPWLHIIGIIAPLFLIVEMGIWSALFTLGLIVGSIVWYFWYAKDRVARGGAIYHIFARLGKQRYEGLDRELRGILKEKGLRDEDPFDVVIAHSHLIDITTPMNFEQVVRRAATYLAKQIPVPKKVLIDGFLQGTRVGATPVSHGVALPHMRLHEIEHPELVMVRTQNAVHVDIDEEFFTEDVTEQPIVHAFFFLVSPEHNPGQHLRILAQIADYADDEEFVKRWLKAKNEQRLKELLLRHERYLSLKLRKDSKSASLIGQAIRDLPLPRESLIALIHRDGEIIFPRGRTRLKEGDRLTIIGEPKGIQQLNEEYRG